MEKLGLLSLPDEILLHIFSYVDGKDKINIFRTCVRFSNVLRDKRLSRKLKLIGNYNVTIKEIRCYLKPKRMRQNIRVLDLTNCYWLQPAKVCASVLKLKNLIAFYSVDVNFTFSQIAKIVNGLPKLKCLSFSWPAVSTITNEECLGSLLFLYIYFPKIDKTNWIHVIHWIRACSNLKQLWLVAPDDDLVTPVSLTTGLDSPSRFILDTLVIVGLQNVYLLGQLRNILRTSTEAKCLWIPGDTHTWWVGFKGIEAAVHSTDLNTWGKCMKSIACKDQRMSSRDNGKIKRLYWNLLKPPFCAGDERFEDLEELQVQYCFSLGLLQPLHMLTVLSIPNCCFSVSIWEVKEEVQLLPKWCPEIEYFELRLCGKCNSAQHRSDGSESILEMIAEWPKLRTLKFKGCWNLRCGKPFDKIFKSCKNLEKLFVAKLGPQYGYMFEFAKALKHCKNLKDFRLEEVYVPRIPMGIMFEALAECPLIERVVIAFESCDKSSLDEQVFNLIEKSSKLVFLCVISPYIPLSQKKRVMKTITKRFKATRPALRCCYLKYLENSEQDNLPAIHLFEMLLPNISGPFELPYLKDFFFEVSNADVAAYENEL